MTPVTENELKALQEKIDGKRVTLDALKEEMLREIASTDFRERVKAEARQLQQNIAKLDAFINGNVQFERLPIEECNDLRMQLEWMQGYYDILLKRISRFD